MKRRALKLPAAILLLFLTISGVFSAGAASAPAAVVKPVELVLQSIKISTGTKIVNVIRVNPKDPSIRFEVGLPNSRLNMTGDYEKMARAKGGRRFRLEGQKTAFRRAEISKQNIIFLRAGMITSSSMKCNG